MADKLNNQKIKFLSGSQSTLDSLTSSQLGAFYLTNDTLRLYIGLDASAKPVPVNQGVIFVNSTQDLPKITEVNKQNYAGKFYFITSSNILCVYSNNSWVQINSDTFITGATYSTQVKTVNSQDIATVTLTLTSNDSNKNVEGDFKLVGKSNINITKGANNEIEFSVPAGDIFKISTDIIDGTDYNSGSASIKLSGSNPDNASTNSSINLKAGENVKISKDTDGAIKINAKDSVVSEVTANANKGNGFDISVTTGAAKVAGTLDPIVKIGSTEIHFVGGKANLSNDIYNKSEIDSRFSGLDAMRYKGTISEVDGTTINIPAGAENGDTYKFTGANPLSIRASDTNFAADSRGLTLRLGDVLIVKGTEPNGPFEWTVIPSGDDTDTRYELIREGSHGIALQESSTNLKGIFDLSTDTTQIELINDDKTSGQRTVKINHKKLATPIDTTEQAQSMSALSDTKINEGQTDILADQVVVDDAGHVTKVTRNKYHIINSHNHLRSNAYDITASTDKTSATIANTVTATDENVNGDFVIKSSNLTIDATTAGNSKAVSIDLNWGSF